MSEFQPYRFQLKAVRQMEQWGGRCLLALEQGLGKSAASALFAARHPDARPVVVVCPAHLKYQWQRELRHHFGFRSDVLESRTAEAPMLASPSPFQIINYDVLQHWVDYLKALKPKYVVGDEVQAVSNRAAKRSRAFTALCRGVPHVAGLSGTPILNRPAELFPILHILRPDQFPAFAVFAQRYCAPRKVPWGAGWDYRGASHLGELHQRLLATCLVRVRKQDVLHDLPAKRTEVVPVALDDEDEYRMAEDDYLRWVATTHPAKKKAAEKATQIAKLTSMRALVGVRKLKAEMAWADAFLDGGPGKLCVFAWHREVLRQLSDRYGKACVLVDGSVTGRARDQAVARFLSDKRTRLFFGNIKAAGTGWSAKGVADFAFFEYPWTSADFDQCLDRGHGIGRGVTGVPTTGWCLTAAGTIEDHLLAVLRRKQKILNQVLDGGKGGAKLDVYDAVTDLLKRSRETS